MRTVPEIKAAIEKQPSEQQHEIARLLQERLEANLTGNISSFIKSLGGLHDAALRRLQWSGDERRLEIDVDDLYSNFLGLPEYLGPKRAGFVFYEVRSLGIEVDLTERGLTLYDWTFQVDAASGHCCEISFSPGGRVIVSCGRIECLKG